MKRETSKKNKISYEGSNKKKKTENIIEIKEEKEEYISSPPEAEKALVIYESPEIIPPEKIRSEVNFLIYPLFKLEKKREDGIIEVKMSIERDNQRLELFWGVYPHPYFGIPGPFDKKVFDAIQEIIEELPRPIQNPIPLGSIYSLCKRIGIEICGKNYTMIEESLKRLTGILIDSKETFYDKGKKKWIEEIFHLFDKVVFIGEELQDGTIADTTYIYLNSKYLDNINNGYVKPIDYKFYRELNSNIARRLYELLGVKFYPIFQRNIDIKFIRYLYDTLCELVPMKKQKYLSLIRQQLEDAIKELKDKEFIERCEIKEENGRFYLYFYPGPRAKEEFNKFKFGLEPYEEPQALRDTNQIAPPLAKRLEAEEILRYFYKRNSGVEVSELKPKEIEQAEHLIYKYGKEISSFIIDYAIEEAKKTNFDMKTFGAVLQYEAIAVGRYEEMKNLEKKRAEEEKQRREKEAKEERERLEAEELARKIDEILAGLSEEELNEVKKEAEKRAKERGSVFINSGKPIPEIIVSICIREIIRERYLSNKKH
ncbi:MAG: replication initiator protein A [bacterium]|nr:replication initiator protein A [bacterium]